MIVCSCLAVTDREIRRLARAGARSPRQLAEACGVGTCCGGCRPSVRAILAEVEAAREPIALVAPAGAATEAA